MFAGEGITGWDASACLLVPLEGRGAAAFNADWVGTTDSLTIAGSNDNGSGEESFTEAGEVTSGTPGAATCKTAARAMLAAVREGSLLEPFVFGIPGGALPASAGELLLPATMTEGGFGPGAGVEICEAHMAAKLP